MWGESGHHSPYVTRREFEKAMERSEERIEQMEASVDQVRQDFTTFQSNVVDAFSAVDQAINDLAARVAAAAADPAKLADLDAAIKETQQKVAEEKAKVVGEDPGPPPTPPTPPGP